MISGEDGAGARLTHLCGPAVLDRAEPPIGAPAKNGRGRHFHVAASCKSVLEVCAENGFEAVFGKFRGIEKPLRLHLFLPFLEGFSLDAGPELPRRRQFEPRVISKGRQPPPVRFIHFGSPLSFVYDMTKL